MRKKFIHAKASEILSVPPTLNHISAWQTASVPGSESQTTPAVDRLWWYEVIQRKKTHLVFVTFHYCDIAVTVPGDLYWKESLRRSVLLTEIETEWTFPPKKNQHPSSQVREQDSIRYSLMSLRAKTSPLSLSVMHGGAGSQSQHIVTASTWLWTVGGCMFGLTGGDTLRKSHTDIKVMMCTVTPLLVPQRWHAVWNDTVLLGSVSNKQKAV